MNCCLWIILLLACRGNCGFGCQNNRRNEWCENNGCGCHDHVHHMHDDGCVEMRMENDDCGCGNDRMEREGCGCDDNRMSYETYGCQENGIPCPPPVPGNYMR